jgi:membrane protein DedA with SNARE-associated domain
VQTTLAWFAGLPPAALYLALGVLAALENVFPPLPTDTVVAFGTWVAARGEGSVLLAFFATWFGNVAGAAGMYAAGRRHGTDWIYRRFPALADARSEDRMRRLYSRYGTAALVLSRFIPGLRAVVPPVAGALRVPAPSAITAMALASGIWYGFIAYVAYSAGSNWDALTARIARSGRVSALAAVALVIAVLSWLLVRAHRQRSVE